MLLSQPKDCCCSGGNRVKNRNWVQQLWKELLREESTRPLGKVSCRKFTFKFCHLCAGASVRKMRLVFCHKGMLVYHEPTYYYHQRHLLIPSIVTFWRKYQKKLFDQLSNKDVVLAGNGRHDSMGHSTKFGTYTIFCFTPSSCLGMFLFSQAYTVPLIQWGLLYSALNALQSILCSCNHQEENGDSKKQKSFWLLKKSES